MLGMIWMQGSFFEVVVLSLLLVTLGWMSFWRNGRSILRPLRFFYITIFILISMLAALQFARWNTFRENIDFSIFILILVSLILLSFRWRKNVSWSEEMNNVDERYQQLIENTPNPIFIEVDGKIIYVNAAGIRLLGVNYNDDILGKRVDSFLKHNDKQGESYSDGERTWRFFEELVYKRNGYAIVEMFVRDIVYQGVPGVKYVMNDITEERETEQKLKAFFTNAADPMFIMDLNQHIVQVNPAFENFIGHEEKEFKGQPACIWLDAEKFAGQDIFNQIVTGSVMCGMDTSVKRDDGSVVPVSVTLSPIRNRDNQVTMVSVVIRDMTVQKKYELALQESENRHRIIAEHSSDYTIMITPSLVTTFVSPSITGVLGYTPMESMAMSFFSLIHPEDLSLVREKMDDVLHKRDSVLLEYRILSKQQVWIWIEVRMIPVVDDQQNLDYIIILSKDIRERKLYEEHLKSMAFIDGLTGIANRRSFSYQIQRYLKNQTTFALFYLDFDHFKWINDTFTHEYGDLFLKEVAHRLHLVIRNNDFAARLGGDEFALLLPNLREEEVEVIANRIVLAFQGPIIFQDNSIVSTVSLGIAMFPCDGMTEDELLRHADSALYYVKAKSGNNYHFYNHSDKINRRKKLGMDLPVAIEKGEFMLVYQPQLDLYDGSILGMEAYMRWQHPDYGLITWLELTSLAEEEGLIADTTLWMLQEAMQKIHSWNDTFHLKMKLAVRLSPPLLNSSLFTEKVIQLLQDMQFASDQLIVEVTEEALISSPDMGMTFLTAMKRCGVMVALENFGTDFCSLCNMVQLPIQLLKYNKSYIYNIKRNLANKKLLDAIAELGNSLGISVLAEGVEEQEQCSFLTRINGENVRGFYYSNPLSPCEVEKWMKQYLHEKELV